MLGALYSICCSGPHGGCKSGVLLQTLRYQRSVYLTCAAACSPWPAGPLGRPGLRLRGCRPAHRAPEGASRLEICPAGAWPAACRNPATHHLRASAQCYGAAPAHMQMGLQAGPSRQCSLPGSRLSKRKMKSWSWCWSCPLTRLSLKPDSGLDGCGQPGRGKSGPRHKIRA